METKKFICFTYLFFFFFIFYRCPKANFFQHPFKDSVKLQHSNPFITFNLKRAFNTYLTFGNAYVNMAGKQAASVGMRAIQRCKLF